MQKGSIGVTTDNIFPVIKKFLYSDHEIFLRELVSNAVDATQKLKTLAAVGDFKGELGNLNVEVSILRSWFQKRSKYVPVLIGKVHRPSCGVATDLPSIQWKISIKPIGEPISYYSSMMKTKTFSRPRK